MKVTSVVFSASEIQSGLDRIRWAEGLIRQLPENHDGRNSWLLNYGRGGLKDHAPKPDPQHMWGRDIAEELGAEV